MSKTISPENLRRFWRERREVALFDVREEGPYAEAHPLWAVSLPVSEIEVRIGALVPRLSAPIVVYDDGEGYAVRAAERISALGYTDVASLDGGLAAYARHGEVYRDVNVPSKAFGELVESIRHTPSLPAEEVSRILASEQNVVVLDSRRFEEYRTMSIPRGQSVPGGELVYRVNDIAPSPETLIVVNCAGRTRSIIGTQSLVNAGIPNRVVALRNGTIGWTLAGLQVETGRTARASDPSPEGRARAQANARRWAEKVGVQIIDRATLDRFVAEHDRRTLHLLDVRTPEEFAAGHPQGFQSAPGGQLVQATDEWVAVRGARLVLYDDDGVRARMTASWLVQLGWEAVVLAEGVAADVPELATSQDFAPSSDTSDTISPADLHARLNEVTIVDLARSPAYSKGHIAGAIHVSGPELARDIATLEGNGPIVLTSPDGRLAAANLGIARASTACSVLVLAGGTVAYAAAGFALETGSERWAAPPIDVYKRPYEGTDNAREAMQGYIDWELQLVAQLANDGIADFHVVR